MNMIDEFAVLRYKSLYGCLDDCSPEIEELIRGFVEVDKMRAIQVGNKFRRVFAHHPFAIKLSNGRQN